MRHLGWGRTKSLPPGSWAPSSFPDTGTNAWSWVHWLTKDLLLCSFPFPKQGSPEKCLCPSIQQMFLSGFDLGFSNSLLKQFGFLFPLGTRLFLCRSHRENVLHYLILCYSAIQATPQMEAQHATLSWLAMASDLDTLNMAHVKVKAKRFFFFSFLFLSPFFLCSISNLMPLSWVNNCRDSWGLISSCHLGAMDGGRGVWFCWPQS